MHQALIPDIQPEKDLNSQSEFLMKNANLSYSFATTGTALMFLKTVLSFFIKDEIINDNSKTSFLKTVCDFSQRFRDACQYSIYAQPGHNAQQPDDTAMDYVDNLDSAVLGRTVYRVNAFMAPWIGMFKAFFPYSHGLLGLPTRAMQAFDDVNSLITSLFWNFRKMVWSLVPYDGRVTTKDLMEKQSQVRDILLFGFNRMKSGLKDLWRLVFKPNDNYSYSHIHYENENQRIKTMFANLSKTYLAKWKTLWSSEYVSNKDFGPVTKIVGEEEADNHWLFIRSKIFSQLISLPMGFLSAALNSVGLVTNIMGNIFDDQFSKQIHNKCLGYGYGLISLSFITGEIPANINKFYKQLKYEKVADYKQLACAAIGAVGMLNKIKILPGFSSLLKVFNIKGVLDKFDREFDNFFSLFFSANRFLLHSAQKAELQDTASNRDVENMRRFDNWWKFLILPIRVLIRDEEVVFDKDKNRKDLEPFFA